MARGTRPVSRRSAIKAGVTAGAAMFAGFGIVEEVGSMVRRVPCSPDLPATELTLLGDQLTSGFSAGHSAMRFEPGSSVVVFGAGPVGVGVIQAGRVLGAGQVIAIDPVRYRREFAQKMGATTVIDPTVDPGTLAGAGGA